MASRTIKTGDDVDAALAFLARQSRPPVSPEEYFMNKVQGVMDEVLLTADNMRFSMVQELMNDSEKGQSISKLRELLGV